MYLDPGFGGMLLQVIVALVAVGGAVLYSLRKKICKLLKKKKDSNIEKSSISSSMTMQTDNDTIDTLDIEKEVK